MSKKTRINRPTTATSTKPPKGRMIWQSTNYAWVQKYGPGSEPDFVKVGPGRTY